MYKHSETECDEMVRLKNTLSKSILNTDLKCTIYAELKQHSPDGIDFDDLNDRISEREVHIRSAVQELCQSTLVCSEIHISQSDPTETKTIYYTSNIPEQTESQLMDHIEEQTE